MSETSPIETIAPARQTSLGLYVTAKEAYDMWQADPGLKVLDVRTPEESLRRMPDANIPSPQTSSLYVTAKEAYDLWQADPGLKILDVRTPEEYVFVGHAPMATNIPFALQTYEWDPEKKALRWELNPEFVAAVQAWAAPDEQILVVVPVRRPLRHGHQHAGEGGRVHEGLEHPRRLGGEPGQGSRQRLRRHAHEERLEELRAAVDVRD